MTKNVLLSISFVLLFLFVNAEGTKETTPNQANLTALVQLPDINSGNYFNCPEDNRIYFRIANFSTERFYFGLRPHFYNQLSGKPTPNWCADSIYIRIFNPLGVKVFQQKLDTTVGSAGFINTYAQAINGPNIGGLVPTGYNPLTITPLMNGAYWIEMYYSHDGGTTGDITVNARTKFPYFDFTVATATNTKYPGRIHSDKWGMVAISNVNGFTGSFNNITAFQPAVTASSEAVFYSYTFDSVVLKTDFEPGFRPIAYNFAANFYGVANTGNWLVDRQSVNSSVAPALANGYKNFLNDPDNIVFPSGIVPGSASFPEPTIKGCPPSGPYKLRYKIPANADVVILIDVNGVDGYQPATTDRIIEQPARLTGLNTYTWDGKDGQGNQLAAGTSFTFSVSTYFQKGKASIPLYDAEINSAGFKIAGIRPIATTALRMYWDDSQLTNVGACGTTAANTNSANNVTGSGISNTINGTQAPAHAWNGTGNIANVNPAPKATYCSSTTANDSTANNFQWDDFGNVRTINTWAYGIESFISKTIKLLCINVAGTVFNDVDASAAGTFNNIFTSEETGTNGGELYAAVIDPETNEVIAYATVAANGTYTINGVPVNSTGLKVIITTTLPVVDAAAPTESIPTGFVATTPKLNTFNTAEVNIVGLNFGIQEAPTANNSTMPNQSNNGFSIPIPASQFTGTDPSIGGFVQNIIITAFPTNAYAISINGISYTSAAAFIAAFPNGATVPANSFGNPTQSISIKPIAGSLLDIVIPYKTIDNAGATSPLATVTIPFSVILPITGLTFTVTNSTNCTVNINWQTLTESNSKQFEIQLSNNGVQFNTIGVIAAKGNSSTLQNYQYKNAANNGLTYYRIKVLYKDGSYEYSNTLQLTSNCNGTTLLKVYPNPVKNILSITGLHLGSKIQLIDVVGRVLNESIANNDNTNIIDLSKFKTGIYTLKIISINNIVSVVRIVKD